MIPAPTQERVTALLADIEDALAEGKTAKLAWALKAARRASIPDPMVRAASARGRARARANHLQLLERLCREQVRAG